MSRVRPRLAFVSPVFLFPGDAGGKIRTANILRGLKGGAFHVELLAPASPEQAEHWRAEIDGVCDTFTAWRPAPAKARWQRSFDLLADLPVNVVADRTAEALCAVQALADRDDVDLIVFDFVHASVLRPEVLRCKSVCFTHNVEAEIFERHAAQANGVPQRWMWRSQQRKMTRFEGAALRRFDAVVAVSERDARHFRDAYCLPQVHAIPTGVDLDHFSWQPPFDGDVPTVVFTGSMDSQANIDGVHFFLAKVWPRVSAALPQARLLVVGRRPPASLVAAGRRAANVEFTGFVDDVRPYIRQAHLSVIPLLVGGGTRIKAFEAMALGSPVVSTALGIEGLDVEPDMHYALADTAESFAAAVLRLLLDPAARSTLSQRARALVESRFGHQVAARAFEGICLLALSAPEVAAERMVA